MTLSPENEDNLLQPWHWTNTDLEEEGLHIVHVLIHSPCSDGFGAAWAYYRALIENPPAHPLKVIFTPENHRWHKTRALLERDTIGRESVIYLDICPTRDLLEKVYEATRGATQVYDHHITGQRECGDLPYCYFDLKRSGAGIAWDVFNTAPRPFLITCIEAGDLWQWDKVPGATEVCIVREVNVRFKFDQWDRYNTRVNDHLDEVLLEGKHYHKYREIVTQMLTGRKVHKLTLKGFTMPAVNASIFQSGVGNHMVTKLDQPAAVYYWNGEYWAFSLRSADHLIDVSKIAEKLGGGGHRNAAGFKVDDLAELNEYISDHKFFPNGSTIQAFSNYTHEEQDCIERLLSPTQIDDCFDCWEWTNYEQPSS